MEKGLARLGQPLVFLLRLLCCSCFVAAACCGFVAAALLRLVCCSWFVALRWQTAAGGPSHFVGPFPFREPMPPAAVCHLSAAGTPTASWPSALSGRQCRLRLSATSALPELQPRPGPVPSRAVNASCGCLPPQRCGHSNRVLARGPCPQVLQRHPGVAKGTSIDPLARGPSTEPLLGQGHVARLSGTGVKPVSCRCFGRTSARHPRREASRWHPGVARQSSIGSSSMKCRCSMDIEVRIGCLSMKCRCFMDVEVRMGCSSIKCRYFMDVEVRIGFLSMKCRYFMDVEVRIGFLSMKCRCFMDVEVRMGCSSMK